MSEQWINQLQPASFRNVPFQVDSISSRAGEDVVVREYPFQDLPTFHVMGEGVEEFTLQAYVVGDDYMAKRDALAKILRGEGVLVHPTQGHIRCHVNGKFTVTENPTAEGGIARFDITFVRAEQRRYPVARANTASQLKKQAALTNDSAKQVFGHTFKASGAKVPGFVGEIAKNDLSAKIASIRARFNKLHSDVDEWGDYLRASRALAVKLIDLIHAPADLADHLLSLMTIPRFVESDFDAPSSVAPLKVLSEMQALFNDDIALDRSVFKSDLNLFPVSADKSLSVVVLDSYRAQMSSILLDPAADFSAVPFRSSSRVLQAQNSVVLNDFTKTLALVQSSLALIELDSLGLYGSQRFIDWYSAAFDSLINTAADWEHLQNLVNLKTKVLDFLVAHPDVSNKVSVYEPSTTQSLLYVSYRLYGSSDFMDELFDNNPHISHPLLVPAGKPVLWVSHG